MDPALFERLLYEEEGNALDFKRDQYPFSKATDDEKAEILKDLLGFANSFRRADAYILIGIDEVRGGRSKVIGISEHLADHSLQQFVNHLTQSPLHFHYEAFDASGVQVGVIRIELQKRPIYLKHDYGFLKKGEVYVRRGSSTDWKCPASPDEIARMGRDDLPVVTRPDLLVEFGDPDRLVRLGQETSWEAVALHLPEQDEIPTYKKTGGSYGGFALPGDPTENRNYYKDFAKYLTFLTVYRPVRLAISTGAVAATDVRVELEVSSDAGIRLAEVSEMPEPPDRRSLLGFNSTALRGISSIHRYPGEIDITTLSDRIQLEANCQNLQPGRTVWSDKFFIAVNQSGEFSLKGRVFAANLDVPKEFVLTIHADISDREMSVSELVQMADSDESKRIRRKK
jgi:hypothetical protein